jgi:hypothetical protein
MAYDTATLVRKDPVQDGRIHLLIEFSGPNVATVQRDFYVTGTTTLADVKSWARGERAALNLQAAVESNLTTGASVDLTTPVVTPTAQETYLARVDRLRQLKELSNLGVTNATLTSDMSSLQSVLGTDYQTGFFG